MKKLLFILLLFTVLIGCSPETTYITCDEQDDCPKNMYCSSENRCYTNQCGKNTDCGKGKCIETPNGPTCECEENAVIPEGSSWCVPTCDGYSEECGKFRLECNMEKGHCDTICQGEGSCPEGYTCVNSLYSIHHKTGKNCLLANG